MKKKKQPKSTSKSVKKRPKKSKPQRKTKRKVTASKTKVSVPKEKVAGVITHYFNKISVGIIKLKTTLRIGDSIHIKGAHDDFTQNVFSMQLNHQDITSAKRGDEIGIKVIKKVHENDKVYIPAGV